MSEAFDPEKVERQYIDFYYGDNEEVVRAADYDKLLALYREARRELNEDSRPLARLVAGTYTIRP